MTRSHDDDAETGARHALDAESFLGDGLAAPEPLLLAFLTSAVARAVLAVYYELRAQQ